MILRLNSRSLDILSLLVASEKPLAAKAIARQLNISNRMVRSSIAPAEPWLQEQRIFIKKVPGEGFSLAGSEGARKNLARMIREYDQALPWLSSTERLQVLLLTLLFADTPPQIKQLQKILNLSRTTTIGIMDSAKNWLKDYQLELIRRPNFGCLIIGDESHWREAVVDLLHESAGDARLLALLQGIKTVVDISYRAKTGLEEVLLKVWARLDLSLTRKVIASLEPVCKGRLSDQAYIKFFLHLAMAIHRNQIGKSINTFPDLSKDFHAAQQLFDAKEIGARVQEQCGVQIPETEIAWLALHIPEISPRHPLPDHSSINRKVESDLSVRNTIDRFLAQVALRLHPSLSVDMDLIRNLSIQFETLLDPQHTGRTSKNPLLGEVQSQYSQIYAVAEQNSFVLNEQLGRVLNDVEVGDVAICLIAAMERLRLSDQQTKKVLVVCSAGVVTAWLLVSRLRAEFPGVEVVEVISALELENRISFEEIDFIVSTIPLKIKNLPTIQVNPLLGLEDCKRLKEAFEKKRNFTAKNNPFDGSTVHLSDLITSETIELGVVADNWQEVVEKAGTKLLEVGAIESQFIQLMKETILEYGPYMVMWPGVVLLHAPPRGVRRLCTSLINLREPIYFGHPENDPVQAAIVLGATDNRSHMTALLELSQMMRDEKARSAIQKTLHKSVILHWVSQYSN